MIYPCGVARAPDVGRTVDRLLDGWRMGASAGEWDEAGALRAHDL